MKLKARIDETTVDVELKVDGHAVTASVDGRIYDLGVSDPEPNTRLIKHGDKVFDPLVSTIDPGRFLVRLGTDEVNVEISDPKRLRGAVGTGDAHGGVAELRTAMHGKIVRLLVETGTEVEKGDAVIVVEAMKMQNELRSPKTGAVREIRGEVGQTVAAGDILLIVE